MIADNSSRNKLCGRRRRPHLPRYRAASTGNRGGIVRGSRSSLDSPEASPVNSVDRCPPRPLLISRRERCHYRRRGTRLSKNRRRRWQPYYATSRSLTIRSVIRGLEPEVCYVVAGVRRAPWPPRYTYDRCRGCGVRLVIPHRCVMDGTRSDRSRHTLSRTCDSTNGFFIINTFY